jgi:molecular chaperone Hsp33
VIEKIEAGIARAGQVTSLMSKGTTPEELLRLVLADFDLEVLETTPVAYKCYCSRERMQTALISMGKAELEALIQEQGRAEMTCQFCDAVHVFEKEDLEVLLASL